MKVIIIGGVIAEESSLLVSDEETFRTKFATRILQQHGFTARNLSGGFVSRARAPEESGKAAPDSVPSAT